MADKLQGPDSGRLAKPRLVALFVVWAVLASCLTAYLLNFLCRVWVAGTGFLSGFHFLSILVTWKTMVLVIFLIFAWIVFVALRRLADRTGMRRGRRVGLFWGLAVVVFVMTTMWSLRPEDRHGAFPGGNHWGFWRPFAANLVDDFRPTNGEVDVLYIETNSESYRDDQWEIPAPDDGTIRALLVGDSVVFGFSLSTKRDLLDTMLEERLNAAGSERWDIWNIANAPASLWYFCESIMRIAPDARPRYAIMVFYGSNDLTAWDEQMALSDKPDWFHTLARNIEMHQDLLLMSSNPWPFQAELKDADAYAELFGHFERLLDFVADKGIHLIVWDATGPSKEFDPYRGREGVSFLSWREIVGEGCGGREGDCRFYEDPELGHPSGHLTPKGNGRVADIIAAKILELEAQRPH